jgi:creatinine amidohydrolase
MMMHLRPELVRMKEIKNARSLGHDLQGKLSLLGVEAAASFSWLADDLNPSGVVGDATRATAQLGKKLVDHYGAALADVIKDAKAFPLDRLA